MELKVLVNIELSDGTKKFLADLVTKLNVVEQSCANKATEEKANMLEESEKKKSPDKVAPKTQSTKKSKIEEVIKEDAEELAKEEVAENESKITIDDLRILMADACKAGKKVAVADCLKNCGGVRLSEIKENDYPKLVEMVKKL